MQLANVQRLKPRNRGFRVYSLGSTILSLGIPGATQGPPRGHPGAIQGPSRGHAWVAPGWPLGWPLNPEWAFGWLLGGTWMAPCVVHGCAEVCEVSTRCSGFCEAMISDCALRRCQLGSHGLVPHPWGGCQGCAEAKRSEGQRSKIVSVNSELIFGFGFSCKAYVFICVFITGLSLVFICYFFKSQLKHQSFP